MAAMNYSQAITQNKDPEGRVAFQIARNDEFFKLLIGKGHLKYVKRSELPAGTTPLPLMWTFIWKICPITGKRLKAKARAVQRGDLAVADVHYDAEQSFSPCPQMAGIKMTVAASAQEGAHTAKADVTGAFINATPSRRVFLYTLEGTHMDDEDGTPMLLEQLSNLYGSKDAAYRWLHLAFEELERLGFHHSLWDPCLLRMTITGQDELGKFTAESERCSSKTETAATLTDDSVEGMASMHEGDQDIPEVIPFDFSKLIGAQPKNGEHDVFYIIAAIWVDDLLLVSNNLKLLKAMLKRFLARFPGTQEMNPNHFLGFSLKRSKDGIMVSQPALAQKAVIAAKMEGANPHATPLTSMVDPKDRPGTNKERMQAKALMPNLWNILGMVGYMGHTRPELLTAYCTLSRVASDPAVKHVRQMKRLVRYVAGTQAHGLMFNRNTEERRVVIYVDTNFDMDVVTGIVAFYNGGNVMSRSQRQKTKTISSFASESVGLSEAVRVALYLQAIARDTGDDPPPPLILCDNQAAIQVVNNRQGYTTKARHFKIRMQWVRQRVENREVEIRYVKSEENVADLLTKPLSLQLWRRLAPQMRGVEPLAAFQGTLQSQEGDLGEQ
jgi:hypothetical protein